MSLSEDFETLEKEIIQYVKDRNNVPEMFHLAFQEKGALSQALKILDEKSQEIAAYNEKALPEIAGKSEEEADRIMNEMNANNTIANNKIPFLRDRLNELKEVVSANKGDWATRRAMHEFTDGVSQGKKVKKGFFSSLFNSIKGAFSFTSKKKIRESREHLNSIMNKFSDSKPGQIDFESKEPEKQPEKQKAQEKDKTQEIPKAPPLSSKEVQKDQAEKQAKPQQEAAKQNEPKKAEPKAPPAPPPLPEQKVANQEIEKNQKVEPKAPPAPPPLPETKKEAGSPPPPPPIKNNQVKASSQKGSRSDLLDSIKQQGGKKRLSKDHANAKGERDFIYIANLEVDAQKNASSGLMQAMNSRIGNAKQEPNHILNDKDKSEQLNMLYSAMISGNDKLYQSFKAHQSQVESGQLDDFDEPIMMSKLTFSQKEIEQVETAVRETQQRIEKGEDLPRIEKSEVVNKPEQKENKIEQDNKQIKEPTVEKAPKDPIIPPPPKPVIQPKSQPGRGNLLKDIADTGKNVLKKVEKEVDLNIDGFTYIQSKVEKLSNPLAQGLNTRRRSMGVDMENFSSLSEKEQLNKLYTAVINDDAKIIGDIADTGSKILSDDNIKKVCSAAQKAANSSKADKKIRIEHAISKATEIFEVDLPKGKSQTRSR